MPLRATLVDPTARTVTMIELPEDGDYTALIGSGQADVFILRPPDDAGPGIRLMVTEGDTFWAFDPHPDRVFAGPGIVFAVDDDGEPVDNPLDPEVVEDRVIWMSIPEDLE